MRWERQKLNDYQAQCETLDESMLNNVLNQLVEDFEARVAELRADRNIHTVILKEIDPAEVITFSVGPILKGVQQHNTLVEIATWLGRRIQQKYRWKRDSVAACQIGWFVTVSFVECKLLEFYLSHSKKKTRYQHYHLRVVDDDGVARLWESVKDENVELFPVN